MSKTTSALIALGVVAGLGVATLPLSSYAVTNPDPVNVPVSLEVEEILEITTNNMAGEEGAQAPATVTLAKLGSASDGANYASDGSFKVNIKSNVEKGYDLAIKGSTDTDSSTVTGALATDLLSSTDRIAAGDLTGTTSSWGYKAGTKTAWTAVETDNVTIYTGSKTVEGDLDIADGKDIPVTFGANVVASQAAGIYTGQVTFTATAVTD